MFSLDKITALFCMIDDVLKAIGHKDDPRCQASDSEVISCALIASLYLGGHHSNAIAYVKTHNLMPKMLTKSRFSRRLERLHPLVFELLHQFGSIWAEMNCEMEYVIDSFPVPVCDNIRISRCQLLKGKEWRGMQASMRRYFYGVKVQVLCTKGGVPIEICFSPGNEADVKALGKLAFALPPESEVFADSAYTDYQAEDDLFEAQQVKLLTQRKSNLKRQDSPAMAFIKQSMRKHIETAFSQIKALFLRRIHATTFKGLLLKLNLFIFAYQLRKTWLA